MKSSADAGKVVKADKHPFAGKLCITVTRMEDGKIIFNEIIAEEDFDSKAKIHVTTTPEEPSKVVEGVKSIGSGFLKTGKALFVSIAHGGKSIKDKASGFVDAIDDKAAEFDTKAIEQAKKKLEKVAGK